MEKIIAYCGIICSECPAFIAKKNDDDDLRKKTAKEWSEQFNTTVKPENVNCDGCLTDGVLIDYCGMCEIRKCGREKKVINCAYCDDYICDKLEKWFTNAPQTKEILEQIRQNRHIK